MRRRPRVATATACAQAACAALLVSVAAPASAQTDLSQRVSIEFAGAVNTASTNWDDPFVFLDATATVRVAGDFDVIVRPYARRLPGGDWSKEMYQLQIRYQPPTRLPLRIDAGIISSPLGIIALEMRPDRNPVIGGPSYYFSPLPSFDGGFDRVQILSGGYPLGALASLSGRRWDARAGVTDGTPARNRKMMSSSRPPARPQLVTGGGVTPIAGLRLGAGYARGVYREPAPATATVPAARGGPRHGLQPRRGVRGRLHAARGRVDPRQLRDRDDARRRARAAPRGRADDYAAMVRRRAHDAHVDAGVRRGRAHAAQRAVRRRHDRVSPVAGDHAEGRLSGLAHLHRTDVDACRGGVRRRVQTLVVGRGQSHRQH